MRRVLGLALLAGAVFLVCNFERIFGPGSTALTAGGWVAVICLIVGGMFGAAYARTQHARAKYKYHRGELPVAFKGWVGSWGALVRYGLIVAAIAAFALYVAGKG